MVKWMPIVLKHNEDSLIYDNVFGNCLMTAMFQLHQAKSLTDIFDWTVYSMQIHTTLFKRIRPKEF